jgi:DNA-binding XRE family transcriptional regulator
MSNKWDCVDFNNWRIRMGYTHAQSAKALGISERKEYYMSNGSYSVSTGIVLQCKDLLKKKFGEIDPLYRK